MSGSSSVAFRVNPSGGRTNQTSGSVSRNVPGFVDPLGRISRQPAEVLGLVNADNGNYLGAAFAC